MILNNERELTAGFIGVCEAAVEASRLVYVKRALSVPALSVPSLGYAH